MQDKSYNGKGKVIVCKKSRFRLDSKKHQRSHKDPSAYICSDQRNDHLNNQIDIRPSSGNSKDQRHNGKRNGRKNGKN